MGLVQGTRLGPYEITGQMCHRFDLRVEFAVDVLALRARS
jgi:hypothetical protein